MRRTPEGIPDKSHALHRVLVEEIRSGKRPPGTRLPSEWDLAETWRVSRTTVRAALAELERLGAIIRGRGKGTFVHADAEHLLGVIPVHAALRVALALRTERLINPIYQHILTSFQEHLDPRVQTSIYHHDHPKPDRYAESGADLIIADGSYLPQEIEELAKKQPRLVLLNRSSAVHPFVFTDNRHGGDLMADHVVKMGHRHIGLIHFGATGTEEEFIQRYEGILARLAEDDLCPTMVRLKLHDQLEFTPLHAVKQLLHENPKVTVILCLEDRLAICVLEALEELRLKVPQQVGVMGFDDLPACRLTNPPLTTIHQPTEEIGQALAAYVVGLIDGPTIRLDQPIRPQLVQRASVLDLTGSRR